MIFNSTILYDPIHSSQYTIKLTTEQWEVRQWEAMRSIDISIGEFVCAYVRPENQFMRKNWIAAKLRIYSKWKCFSV